MTIETKKDGCVKLRAAGLPTEGVVADALPDFVIAENEGRPGGIRDVFLLTTTAEYYFPRFGFACVSRESVPEAVRASAEFQGACPSTAVVMRKTVRG